MIGFVLKDTASHIAPFKILDYIDRLNVIKENPREYHCLCPVCGDGGFKINKSNGKYQAFKCGCDVKDIREVVRPWSEVSRRQEDEETGGRRVLKDISAGVSFRTPSDNREKIKLAQLNASAENAPKLESALIPEWLIKQGIPPNATETRYWYSKTQWVSRFEWTTEERKKAKTIRQGHIKSNGLIQWSKGSKDWRAYKLGEAVKHCQEKWVLGLEGEGCVETARAIALSGITWQGSNWNEKNITSDLTKLIEGGAAGIVYFPDHDEVGQKKAELIKSACQSVDLPCLIISPTDVWGEMPAKGDISPCWYLDTEKWLYANYCEYCHNSGTRPVSLRRFVTLLSDLGKNQLGLDIRRERDRLGSYFVGLKIRDVNDTSPPLITGNSKVVINVTHQPKNINIINRVWTMVMDKVMDVIDYVIGETIDSDECDGCDGIIKKSPESKNSVEARKSVALMGTPSDKDIEQESKVSCNTIIESTEKKKERSDKFLNMPSPKVESVITVGDRVMIDDCPGHWSWASPFAVETIEGEMVKLEMVSDLVLMERLSLL